MSLYVDSSGLAKRYLREAESRSAVEFLRSDPEVITARHTFVEVHQALRRAPERDRRRLTDSFLGDWEHFRVVELDGRTCERAAEFVTVLGVRTLDALHLAAAHRVGGGALPFLTFDLRQAQAARSLGWTVLGV